MESGLGWRPGGRESTQHPQHLGVRRKESRGGGGVRRTEGGAALTWAGAAPARGSRAGPAACLHGRSRRRRRLLSRSRSRRAGDREPGAQGGERAGRGGGAWPGHLTRVPARSRPETLPVPSSGPGRDPCWRLSACPRSAQGSPAAAPGRVRLHGGRELRGLKDAPKE